MKSAKPAKHQVIRPMEAKSVTALPAGANWVYEP
ncbi:hypothetical protein ABID65_008834 [Bradyrhizobium sp. S3.9.2]